MNIKAVLPVLVWMALCGCSKPAGNPFDPEHSLYSEHPLTQVLMVSVEVKKSSFVFGDLPQYELTFTNVSDKAIDLSGAATTGDIHFRPYIGVHILRADGRDIGYGNDLKIEPGSNILGPKQSVKFDFPDTKMMGLRGKSYRYEPSALLPGKYQVYVQLWVDHSGKPERLLSSLKPLVITEDDAGLWKMTAAAQKAEGVVDYLELEIAKTRFNQVGLTARNTGTEPIYLGNDWRWRQVGPWSVLWTEDGGGLRPGGCITIPPGGSISLGGRGFNTSDWRGNYEMEVRYFDREGNLKKTSNRIIMKVE